MFAIRISRAVSRPAAAGCRAFSSGKAAAAAEVQAGEIKKLGVVGAGQMGLGIALVAARVAQVPVTVVDNSQKSLDKGLAFAGICSSSMLTTVTSFSSTSIIRITASIPTTTSSTTTTATTTTTTTPITFFPPLSCPHLQTATADPNIRQTPR